MFVSSNAVYRLRTGPRRVRGVARIRARAALAAVQPAAHRASRLARLGLAIGAVVIVVSLVPAWLGYEPRADDSGSLTLVSVAGSAVASTLEATPALVVPVPHLASIVEASGSMPGRLALFAIPLLGLFFASLVRRAGRQWPADRIPSLARLTPGAHRARFPQGGAPRRLADHVPIDVGASPRRPSIALLTVVAAIIAFVGLVGRRPHPRG